MTPSESEVEEPQTTPNRWWGDLLLPTANKEVSDGAEPSILESKDGRFVWIGDTSGLYISKDHGQTWVEGDAPFLLSADGWTLAEDDTGTLFYSTTTTATLTIASSDDGGFTTTYSSDLVDVAPVADRPWLAARGDGELALFMYDFGRTTSETCVRSTDGGETWPDRGLLSQAPQGGGALFDDEGNAYVGLDNGRIVSYGQSCLGSTADLGTTVYQMFTHNVNSHMLNPTLENGTLYMAAQADGDSHGLMVASYELATGARSQYRIEAPATTTVMFPRTDAQDGRLVVSWYGSETTGDPTVPGYRGEFNVYAAVVDHLTTNPSHQIARLTDIPNHVGDICVGGVGCGDANDRDLLDYFGMDIGLEGRVHIAYGDDRDTSQRRVSYVQFNLNDVPLPDAPMEETTTESSSSSTTSWTSSTDSSTSNSSSTGTRDPTDSLPSLQVHLRIEGTTAHGDASESYDPDGGEISARWTWGDGTQSEGLQSSHVYKPGTYMLLVEILDDEGNRQYREQEITLEAPTTRTTTISNETQTTPGSWGLASVLVLGWALRKSRRQG